MEFELNYRATDTEIIFYWDKPEQAGADAVYEAILDGEEEQLLSCTHCTFTGLKPDTQYRAQVCLMPEEGSDGTPEFLGEMQCRTAISKRRIDVTKEPYLAAGDGVTLNTQALQKAIDDAGAEDQVYLPAGKYLTGALNLHSNMELYLEKGAFLQGTESREDYLPQIPSRFEGYERECYRSLLNLGKMDHNAGYNCENVVIRGKGTIYGGGAALAKDIAASEQERLKEYIASLGDQIKEYERPETIANRARGRLINMSNCQNIWIHGLDLGYGASWNVHFVYSDSIVTDHCRFHSQGVWNGDGWDPDSSTNCTCFDCEFFTEDDSVAIKSGKNPEGNEIAKPTRNIRVFDCVTHLGHGLCMGSEMSGGIEGIRIWDCEMGPTWSGIEIKATKKRGAYVRDVVVRDVTASHIMLHSVGYNDDGIGAKEPPVFEDCHFERMYLLGRYLDNNGGHNEWHDCPSIEVQGFDVPGYEARNIKFKDITMENAGDLLEVPTGVNASMGAGGSVLLRFCKGVSLENIESVPRAKSYEIPKEL